MNWARATGGLLALLWIVRLWWIPSQADLSLSMSHDSAYILQLARNLENGKGFVNDATFLTFLNLGTPPVPYHNANPLYACLIVMAAKMTGWALPAAGVAISVTAHILAVVLMFLILRRLGFSPTAACAGAGVAGLFPSIWRESYTILPDMLTLFWMLLAVFLVIESVERRSYGWWAMAGMAFGLAWLTRSTALLLLPGLAWYGWRKGRGWRDVGRFAVAFALMALTCLPWLLHTWRTWGNPFRSDTTWSGLQDYYTRQQGSDIFYMWFSPVTPPAMGEILSREGRQLALFVLGNLPHYVYNILRGWFPGHMAVCVLFGCWALLAIWVSRFWTRRWTPGAEAWLLLVATSFTAMALRPMTIEVRYLNLSTFVLCAGLGAILVTQALEQRRAWLVAPLAVFVAICGALNATHTRDSRQPSEPMLHAREVMRSAQRYYTHDELVATDRPYFWAYFMEKPALAPAVLPGNALAAYLKTHGCRWLLLHTDSAEKLQKLSPREWTAKWRTRFVWPEDAILFERIED